MKRIMSSALAITISSGIAVARPCGPINPATSEACITPGAMTSADGAGNSTNYRWHFNNSCDHSIDIMLGNGEVGIPPGGNDFSCNSQYDRDCPWKTYSCIDRGGHANPFEPSKRDSGAPTSATQTPSERDEIEASLELKRATMKAQLSSIVKNWPGTRAAETAKQTLVETCSRLYQKHMDNCYLCMGRVKCHPEICRQIFMDFAARPGDLIHACVEVGWSPD